MLTLSGQSPSEGSKLNGLGSLVEFSIIDDGTGLDLSSLIVEVGGATAIRDLEFSPGFDGAFSDISTMDAGASIVIEPETLFSQGEVVLVKIQIKNLDEKYFNFEYVFKIIPAEPILELSSPEGGDLVQSDQVLFLQFKDEIDDIDTSSINVWVNGLIVVSAGIFQEYFNGNTSLVTKTENGASVRVEPTESFRDGSYTVKYTVRDLSGNILSGNFTYTVDLPKAILPSTFPQVRFLGFSQGIRKVANVGRGDMLKIEWYKPISRSYKGDSFSLIYQDESRLDIFDSNPKYIATGDVRAAEISGFTPGLTLAFAARALETFSGTLNLESMSSVADGIFRIPDNTSITEQVLSDATKINVASTEGYPSIGVLLINNSEVIRYTSKTDTSFLLPSGGRGLNGTSPGIYIDGDTVKMFLACQDKNSVIITGTPTYIDGYESGREIGGTGLVVTDYTDNDAKFFQGFDFCGYHRAIPQQIFQGSNDCGSYLGGEFNNSRGMNLFDRMLNREEVLLDQVGEPIILLKRIWDGPKCSCSDSRRMHPKIKGCKLCYGTGYTNGYTQYSYRRRSDGRVMVMFGDTQEDLVLGSHNHLEQKYEPVCWTLPSPAIKDRDLIVRFDFNNNVEYIYEVLNITKDKLFYRHYTRQRLNLKRMDKTDIMYTFPYSFNT